MRKIVVLAIFLSLAHHAVAQVPSESLLFTTPSAYKTVTDVQKGDMHIREYIPKSESLPAWTEMLTVQTFRNMAATPKQFRETMGAMLKQACKENGMFPISESTENGYSTAVWFQACEYSEKLPRDELTWIKVIKGKEAFYVVQKAFRFQPEPEQTEPWIKYLKNLRVCDARVPDSACPHGNTSTTAKSSMRISPIFGELFAHNIPAQFQFNSEQTRGDVFVRALTLATDQTSVWTQRLLLISTKNLAKQADQTAKTLASKIAKGFQQACPTTYSGSVVLEGKTPTGHEMFVMMANCGSHTLTAAKTATSESTLVVAIRGNLNMYTVQWSERGTAQDTALVPSMAAWMERLKTMGPILVCEQKPDEPAPFLSCTGK